MPSILFVCTANICRSPMAEALFKKLVRESGYDAKDWHIESAGTWAKEGLTAAEGAVRTMQSYGLDITSHRSRSVSKKLLKKFDLIFTMESGQKEALKVEFPQIADQVFLLSELSDLYSSIKDPFGKQTPDFEKTAEKILHFLQIGVSQIKTIDLK